MDELVELSWRCRVMDVLDGCARHPTYHRLSNRVWLLDLINRRKRGPGKVAVVSDGRALTTSVMDELDEFDVLDM